MTKEEFEKLYAVLDQYVKANVNEHRYNHIQGVVHAAEKYAVKYGADVYKAKIAAVFHDACKNDAGALEHGEAAASLIQSKFGVNDPEIVAAIANHTIGRKDMCLLEKIIKLADLLEEGRNYNDVPFIRAYEERTDNIDLVYLFLLKRQRAHLIEKGIDYDKRTDELILYMSEVVKHNMTNKDIAYLAAEELDRKKAGDISIIDIAEKSGFADYFVIATAGSLRQMGALSDTIEDKMAELGIFAHHVEGRGDSGWILMDFGDVIINIFTAEQREHYNIEKVWNDCLKLDYEPADSED